MIGLVTKQLPPRFSSDTLLTLAEDGRYTLTYGDKDAIKGKIKIDPSLHSTKPPQEVTNYNPISITAKELQNFIREQVKTKKMSQLDYKDWCRIFKDSNDNYIHKDLQCTIYLNSINQVIYIHSQQGFVQLCLPKSEYKLFEELHTNSFKGDNTNMFNFNFGPVEPNTIKLSPYGLAIRSQDKKWVSYDPNTQSIMDVEILNFEMDNFIYYVPTAVSGLKPGDMVEHNQNVYFVKEITENTIKAIDLFSGSVAEILPTRNIFGFNFITKVTPLMDFSSLGASANADNPFGNFLPFMVLDNSKSQDNNLLPLVLMMSEGGKMDMSNPLMMYAMCGQSDTNNILPMMLLMQQQQNLQK